jgi:hypothetical protein
VKGSGRTKVLSQNLPGGTEENYKKLSQDSRSPGLDFNPGTCEYEAQVLTTRQLCSVLEFYRVNIRSRIKF